MPVVRGVVFSARSNVWLPRRLRCEAGSFGDGAEEVWIEMTRSRRRFAFSNLPKRRTCAMSRFFVPSVTRGASSGAAYVSTSTALRYLIVAVIALFWAGSPAYAQTCTMPRAFPSPIGEPPPLSFSTCGHESVAQAFCGGAFSNMGPNVVVRFFYDGSAHAIRMAGGEDGFDPMMFVSDSVRGCADGAPCLLDGDPATPCSSPTCNATDSIGSLWLRRHSTI